MAGVGAEGRSKGRGGAQNPETKESQSMMHRFSNFWNWVMVSCSVSNLGAHCPVNEVIARGFVNCSVIQWPVCRWGGGAFGCLFKSEWTVRSHLLMADGNSK